MIEGLHLRPNQKEILSYLSGRMGISAVPGSGKTYTLSLLAADLILKGRLADDQEVLIVTLVNSAVDNFYQRVSEFISRYGLLPNLSYRVRTLHGLAHDIVRERPGLVGLADDFQIIDEREANAIRDEVAQAWLRHHPEVLEGFLSKELDEYRAENVRKNRFPELVKDIALSFIRYAKDMRYTPEHLRQRLDNFQITLPLAEMGCEIFTNYQRALAYRGAVDFDDLIRLALVALKSDPDYLKRLRERWPYILEDEAQDSSRLQEEILSLLVGKDGNWVRVGDPNQAIFETFTTASPEFLRKFITRKGVKRATLPHSGRSSLGIIELANDFVRWTNHDHPLEPVRDALQALPLIEPTLPGDPQPNPPDEPGSIVLVTKKNYSAQEEIQAVVSSLQRWLPDHPDWTVAVLAPRNERGNQLADELRRQNIDYEDGLLRSSSATRASAGALTHILRFLADPSSTAKLATVYKVWRRADRDEPASKKEVSRGYDILRRLRHVEEFLWPAPGVEWYEPIPVDIQGSPLFESLAEFRLQVQRWQQAVVLPVDQVVLTLAQDLFSEPVELALAHKLALLLRQSSQSHSSWRLAELTEELAVIARNERRFLGFSNTDNGFDPNQYRGKVVIATIHKAKGLEWDRVYLMSINNYDFPSGAEGDQYLAEKWYLNERLNLPAEALAQLKALDRKGEFDWLTDGAATIQARYDYIRERLRLLYVGITRARRQLVMTWNTGRHGDMKPALPLLVLAELEGRRERGLE